MNIENKIITTIENAKQNVVKITTSKKKGFLKKKQQQINYVVVAFFLKNNYIITNAHVVENMDNLKIELINGKYTSTIIGKNID